jgi:YVTN family beta-propeller protein
MKKMLIGSIIELFTLLVVLYMGLLLVGGTNENPVESIINGFTGTAQLTNEDVKAAFEPVVVPNIQPSKTYAYITHKNDSNISVIDIDVTKAVSKINIDGNVTGISLNSIGSKLYISSWKTIKYQYFGFKSPSERIRYQYVGLVYVFDKNTGVVGYCIPVGKILGSIALTPDGKKFYVLAKDRIKVVDTATNNTTEIQANLPYATNMAITPDGNTLLVTDWLDTNDQPCSAYGHADGNLCGEVAVIDTKTDKVINYMETGRMPFSAAITPDGKKAYIVNNCESNIVSVDTTTWKILSTIRDSNTTRPINLMIRNENGMVTGEYNQGASPAYIAINPAGTKAYVTNSENNTVAVINLATDETTAMIHVGKSPYGVAFTPDGKYAYVANSQSDTVSVIDAKANNVVATVPVGHEPIRVVIG